MRLHSALRARSVRVPRAWRSPMAVLVASGLVAIAGEAHAQVTFRTIAAKGDPAPGIADTMLTFPQVATIAATGHVAFTSLFDDGQGLGGIGIWLGCGSIAASEIGVGSRG